ncbi:hypothetical protein [Streptomyces sp. NPDC058665]|uniref:hypothetical protein n=1 Tax=Streptomyces sp. NPDC058665 TaxID=3346586 RepID=UPI003657D309
MLSPHPDDTAWLQQTALQLLDEHRALGRSPSGYAASRSRLVSWLKAVRWPFAATPSP